MIKVIKSRYWLHLFILAFISPLYGEIIFPEIKGTCGAIIHAETGKILYAKNIDTPIYPASMTKVATALFILRKYPEVLNRFVTVKHEAIASISPQAKKQSGYRSPAHWLETDSTTIQLQLKEEVSGWDLFHALLIVSANDAANALATACCGSVKEFMQEMNVFLKEIGCSNTQFNNPHGLHHPAHYTTAKDLTLVMCEALKEPLFCQIIQTTNYKMAATNLNAERILSPTNKLILPGSTYYYPAALGGKTGTTKDAGKNLLLAARKNNRKIITIATGYTGSVGDLYQDIIALCESVFNEPLLRRYLIPPTDSYILSMGQLGKISIALPEGVYYDFYESEGEVQCSVNFVPQATSFPINKGNLLGHWVFRNLSGRQIKAEPLYAEQTIIPSKAHRIRMLIKKILLSYRTYLIIVLILLYRKKQQGKKRKYSYYL
ncbi:D-alanyl-D-alanine carboxypeptidase family protein [Chlamydia ibidis]|uniref:D-alanyl-D-alanine carboxypeptidase family protein n=2 Tax=Chlamydia ibidis TaxID=1405396 RepID=S7J3V8_9CHLA|nr:D-alanyl-D-alanine carboxypeptidase family protein [Chlamydia ibidis]EPP34908.1 D-alanyl-D-alanine carboxypeptidase family protein [Chlamydia ibidis]EQM63013.1 D-alanyl-D-alanine carboxypeptidase family protein [Chlamydia ibidis 10-1398/6]